MHKRYSYTDYKCNVKSMEQKIVSDKNCVVKIQKKRKTYLGKNIYLIKFGTGKKNILLTAAFHGAEDITAKILMNFMTELVESYRNNSKEIIEISQKITIYSVPMVNPDGISISMNEINPSNPIYSDLLSMNNGNTDFIKWQANARGVDINHNFDADWEKSRGYEQRHGIIGPTNTKYAGKKPESEVESRFLAELVRKHRFESVVAFHSQGEEIYYDFNGIIPKNTMELVENFERVSGYKASIPSGSAAFGGFKDWFIKKYNRPGFTIEVGLGENPLPPEQFEEIYPKASAVIWELLRYYV